MKIRFISIVLFTLLATLPLRAAEPIPALGPNDTLAGYFNRLVDADKKNIKDISDQKTADAKDNVEKKATSETAPDAANSLRDFLPLFFTTLGLGTTTEDKDALTLNFNPSLLRLTPGSQASLKGIIRKATVFEAMTAKIPEEIREQRKSALSGKLADFDDTELDFSWSRKNDRFGRDVSDHRALIARMYQTLFDRSLGPSENLISKALTELVDVPLEVPSGQLSPEQLEKSRKAIERLAQDANARRERRASLADSSRFFRLADLVNNQPQLIVSAVYRRRDDLVGPDEQSFKLSYERGMANVNGLRRFCARRQSHDAPDPDCLKDYVDEYGGVLETTPRLSFSAEYSWVDPYDFALPADNFSFHLDRVKKRTANLSGGFYLPTNKAGIQTTRLDFLANYEDVTGDPMRNNRFTATATFTQKMSDDTSATFSVLYANKPEYLDVVDKKLGARVGLKYKIDKKKDSPSN